MTNATLRRIGVTGVAVAGALFLPAGIAVAGEPASAACERSQPYYVNDRNLSHVVVNTGQNTQSRAQNCSEAVPKADAPGDGWSSMTGTGWLLTLFASDTDDEGDDEPDAESDDNEPADNEGADNEGADNEGAAEPDDNEAADNAADDESGSADDASTPETEPADAAKSGSAKPELQKATAPEPAPAPLPTDRVRRGDEIGARAKAAEAREAERNGELLSCPHQASQSRAESGPPYPCQAAPLRTPEVAVSAEQAVIR